MTHATPQSAGSPPGETAAGGTAAGADGARSPRRKATGVAATATGDLGVGGKGGERSSRLRPEERRSQILDAARRVLEADPHRELTVELVAAEAQVSPALLFHYFGSKKKFQYAVIEEAAAEVMLRTAPDLSLPPEEQLRSGIRAFVRAVLEAPQLYRATLLMSAAGDPAVRALHTELRQVFSRWVIDAVAASGTEVTPAVELLCHGWQGYVEQTLLTWIENPTVSPDTLEHLCEGSLAALLTTV